MSKMRDSDLTLAKRIDAAMYRIAHGSGHMRVPVEATDPDMVLSDCMKALDYYRAGLEQRAPKWVPCRVLLEGPVRGDYPIGHTTLAEAGACSWSATTKSAGIRIWTRSRFVDRASTKSWRAATRLTLELSR